MIIQIRKARADARSIRKFEGEQGAEILHPFTLKVCGYKDHGDRMTRAYGMFGDICTAVYEYRGKWFPMKERAFRYCEDYFITGATDVWAVRVSDDTPIKLF